MKRILFITIAILFYCTSFSQYRAVIYNDTLNTIATQNYVNTHTSLDTGALRYTNIACWGNSLTAGYLATIPYPTWLSKLSGFSTFNGGVSGEISVGIRQRMVADSAKHGWSTIIWAGRNDVTLPEQVKANIALMVSALGHNRYIVLSIPNGDHSDEWKDSSTYNTIIQVNNDLAVTYGNHFLDIRSLLVADYNPAIPQDVIDHNHDVPPSSLRASDWLHFNDSGYLFVAKQILKKIAILTDTTKTIGYRNIIDIMSSPTPIGTIKPNSGHFTDLSLYAPIGSNSDSTYDILSRNSITNSIEKVPLTDLIRTPHGWAKRVDGSDLNNLIYSGFYSGNSLVNSPIGSSEYFFIAVESFGESNIKQTATGFTGGVIGQTYTRIKYVTWGAWAKNNQSNENDYLKTIGGFSNDITGGDLNGNYNTGFYFGSNITNAPDNQFWHITIERGNFTYYKQTATAYVLNSVPTGTTYIRTNSGGTWGAWAKVWSDISQPSVYTATQFKTSSSVFWSSGTGSPEGVVVAGIGSMYTRTDGSTGTTLYVKESGTSNTGWVAK